MLSLSPTKLLVVLVLALILLGPDKLPQVSRQLGAAWNQLRTFRQRVEAEVRDTMPDLPSTADIARLTRSPISFLNSLADLSIEDEPLVADHGAEPAANGKANGSLVSDPGAPEPGEHTPTTADGALARWHRTSEGTASGHPAPGRPAPEHAAPGTFATDDPSMN